MSAKESRANCVGDYPALHRFTYTHEVPERGGDDGDTFLGMRTVHGQYDVVAMSPGLAIEAFKLDHPASIYALKDGPTFICYVDALVGVSKNYGGHFS